jgi:hypothetical protein
MVTSRDLLAGTGISFGWLAPRCSTDTYDSGAAARVVLVRPCTASAMSLTWALSLVIAIVASFRRETCISNLSYNTRRGSTYSNLRESPLNIFPASLRVVAVKLSF